jgi:hypothetical protein
MLLIVAAAIARAGAGALIAGLLVVALIVVWIFTRRA